MRKKRNKRKKITQAINKTLRKRKSRNWRKLSLRKENTTIESILFLTERMQRKRLRSDIPVLKSFQF